MASSSHTHRGDGGKPWHRAHTHTVVAVTMEDIRMHTPPQDWRLNYQALVHISELNTEWGTPVLRIVDIFEEDPRLIHTFELGVRPTPSFVSRHIPWSWKGMLRELSDLMLEKVVGDGIKGISCLSLIHI